MPTYGYECKSCGHTFDVFQSMSDEAIKICPECGKEVRRLINGGTGIIFKGSGFYVTDKGKSGSGAPKPAKAAPGSPSDKQSDKQPDKQVSKEPTKESSKSASTGDNKPVAAPAASTSNP
jgi:putative FmdB family regulatory protein